MLYIVIIRLHHDLISKDQCHKPSDQSIVPSDLDAWMQQWTNFNFNEHEQVSTNKILVLVTIHRTRVVRLNLSSDIKVYIKMLNPMTNMINAIRLEYIKPFFEITKPNTFLVFGNRILVAPGNFLSLYALILQTSKYLCGWPELSLIKTKTPMECEGWRQKRLINNVNEVCFGLIYIGAIEL